MNRCGIIVCRQDSIIGDRRDHYLAECVLPECHESAHHEFVTPEGERWAWETDYECDCCAGDETDHCYTFWTVTGK